MRVFTRRIHQINHLNRLSTTTTTTIFQQQRHQFSTATDNIPTPINTNESVSQPTIARSKLRVKNILEKKKTLIFTISDQATVSDAISHLSTHNISASLTLDQNGEISGLFTARDILRYMHESGKGRSKEKTLSDKISAFIVKKDKLLVCSPNDTALQARQMMAQSKIRHIPAIENGEVLGIITIKDLADSSFSVLDIGGKKGFIQNVTGRKGVPEGTRISKSTEPRPQVQVSARLAVEAGSFALPHPFKQNNGCGASRRDYGAKDLCMDLSLCEGNHNVYLLITMCTFF